MVKKIISIGLSLILSLCMLSCILCVSASADELDEYFDQQTQAYYDDVVDYTVDAEDEESTNIPEDDPGADEENTGNDEKEHEGTDLMENDSAEPTDDGSSNDENSESTSADSNKDKQDGTDKTNKTNKTNKNEGSTSKKENKKDQANSDDDSLFGSESSDNEPKEEKGGMPAFFKYVIFLLIGIIIGMVSVFAFPVLTGKRMYDLKDIEKIGRLTNDILNGLDQNESGSNPSSDEE